MTQRILIWTQHLLGLGHFMRTAHVARGLGASGFDVVVASGGVTPEGFSADGYRLFQLPAVQAKDALFDELVDAQRAPITRELMNARRRMLVNLHDEMQPDCIITETFPFGRRLVEEEVLALLDRAQSRLRRPRILASVRDVLQRPRKADRAKAMVDRARALYDRVLVHADPAVIEAHLGFEEMAALGPLLRYTGYVGPHDTRTPGPRRGVLVSAGGGAVGQSLVATAIAAKPMTRLRDHPWIVVTGPLTAAPLEQVDGIRVERSLPDFAQQLACAALSVSQAGYNTIVETLAGRTPCVTVPFETEREKEQVIRAQRLAALGLLTVVRNQELTPLALAQAVDERFAAGMPAHAINLRGVEGTVAAVREACGVG